MAPNRRLVVILSAALLAAACETPLPCDGPSDCRGNACCFNYQYFYGPGSTPTAVYCTATPDSCVPTIGTTNITTRLCRTDEDCVAGGLSTWATLCCPATVMSRFARICDNHCDRTGR